MTYRTAARARSPVHITCEVASRVLAGPPGRWPPARRSCHGCEPVTGRHRRRRRRRCTWRAGPARSVPGRISWAVRGSAWEAVSWMSRSGTPASSAAVMKACLSVCGPTVLVIPALRATRRTIRPAPCRSSRCPSAARKMGPSLRSPIARSICPGGAGRERDSDDLATLAGDHQGTVPTLDAERLDAGFRSFRHAQPIEGQQGDQCMLRRRPEPGGDQQRAELVAVQAGCVRLVVQARAPDMRGGRAIEEFFLDGVPVEARHGAQAAGELGGLGLAAGFQIAGEELDVGAAGLEQAELVLLAPASELAQVQLVKVGGSARCTPRGIRLMPAAPCC